MKKIIIFLSFLLLTNCGYQPIFSKKGANFLIEEIIFDQNDKISLKIRIKLNSEKKIDISSKDSKGDPLIYKMLVITNLEVYSNGIAINKKEIIKSFSYKNTTNKFDLKQYEITIENNLINSIKEDIILILYD